MRHRYALVDSSLELNGKVVASDPLLGVSLYRLDGPLRSMTTVTGPLPERHVVGAARRLHAPRLQRRLGRPRRCSATRPSSRRRSASRPTGASHLVSPGKQATLTVPLQNCRAVFTVTPTRVPGNGDPRRSGSTSSASSTCLVSSSLPGASLVVGAIAGRRVDSTSRYGRAPAGLGSCRERVSLRGARLRRAGAKGGQGREDRLRRLAALASPQRRRQLHPRLARGARRGGRRAPRDRRLRADEPGREAGDPRGARGDRRRDADRLPAVRARLAHRLEPPAVAGRRAVPRPLRRAPLHRLDVPAAARRASLDDGARPRPAALPGVGAEAHRVDARREVPPHGAGVRRDLHELGVHRRGRRRDLRRADGAAARRLPGRGRLLAGRPARLPRPPLRAHGGDARAAQEPVHAGRGLPAPRHGPRARGRRRQGLGRAAAARRPGSRAARLPRAHGAARLVPRRLGVRLPVAVRGLRDADRRGDGERRPLRRLGAPVDGRGLRGRGRPRRPGEPGGDRGGDRAGARRARPARALRGSTTRGGSPGSPAGGRCSPRTRRRRDPRGRGRLAAAPDPRRHRARDRGPARPADAGDRARRARLRPRRPARDARARSRLVPVPAAAAGTWARRAALPDLPRARRAPRCRS